MCVPADSSWKARLGFMTSQLLYTLLTSLPTLYCFQHYWAHVALFVTIFCVSVWNGAGYYIEVRCVTALLPC